jgi:hypothetical protein
MPSAQHAANDMLQQARFCSNTCTGAELKKLMGKEKEFTQNVQLKHLQQYSAGDADMAEDLLMMAQTNLHAITQFTGVVSIRSFRGSAFVWHSALAWLAQQADAWALRLQLQTAALFHQHCDCTAWRAPGKMFA